MKELSFFAEYFPLIFVGAVVGTFAIIFTAAYLSIKDKKEAIGFDRHMKDSEITKRLIRYAKPYVGNFLLVLCIMLVSIVYNIVSPYLIGQIEELIKNDFPLRTLWIYVAVYFSILIVSLICTYIQSIILQKTGQKILSSIREDLFSHIESLSHAQLSEIPVGKLVTRVTNDTGAISMMFTNILVNLIKNVFMIFGVLGAMLILNYMLTLMILCFVPFILLFTVIFRKFSRKAYRRVKDGTTAINTFLSENLEGMKIIQIFNREERKNGEFREKNDELGKAKKKQIFVFSVFRPVVYMLYISSVLCLFYLGAKGVIRETEFLGQTIKGSTIVSFYMYISTFFNPIQSLAEQFNWLQSAYASAEKIFTVFDMEPGIKDAPDAIDLDSVEGNIEFRNVWFAYKEGEWVLKDVSFKVEAGQTVAFVGATGSGKTTILSLICRNYDIQKGEILLDGIDIRKIKVASLRRHFGQMLQDVFLFSGTIRSNILLHKDDVSDEEVMRACRYVNADTIINRFEKGLDEEVRERGNNFSAGQRQLLSFARTIVHQPEILILDEATANIDTETEVLIQDSLEKLMNVGTLFMVAHRLSTVQHADVIFVLSKGEIVERGSHAELLRAKGRYYDLYTLQTEKEKAKLLR
ncbi:MAG: ABC transporter ATP-binding protein/permease [Lachnospiraceae bacterium]|nr:ABC transporter ATP-binding protein/permease [Lachnospiraceae bacterium]